MIRYLLFDFDGTLADSKIAALAAINLLAPKYGYRPVEPEELETLRRQSITERCRTLGIPVYKIPMLVGPLYQAYRQQISCVTLFKGIPEMLTALKAEGYKLAIISSNSVQNIQLILQQQDVQTIDAIISSRNIFGKASVIRKFLKSHQLQPAEVLYVGDELRDVVACKQAGIRICWVSWGFDAAEIVMPAAPDLIIHEPAQLPELLAVEKDLA